MAIELPERIRIDYISDETLLAAGIRLGMLRLDEIHPLVSGNKWFKLKENIRAARQQGADTLLSFGGAFSNHLLAVAAAAHALGLSSTGIVRGEEVAADPSGTLQQCAGLGMQLVYVSREEYRRKNDADYRQQLRDRYPEAYLIPEGGNNEAGRTGAQAIAAYIPGDTDLVTIPLGTGATFSGVRAALDNRIAMLGFPAMKGGMYLRDEIAPVIPPAQSNWKLNDKYHFGGFARYTDTLLAFVNTFYEKHGIPLDFVYTAKMIYGLWDMILMEKIPPGSHIIAVHTGGLQGNRSIARLLACS